MEISKIIKIEYVLAIPDDLEKELVLLVDKYKNHITKSLKIIKKNKYRLKTQDFIKNIEFDDLIKYIEDYKGDNPILDSSGINSDCKQENKSLININDYVQKIIDFDINSEIDENQAIVQKELNKCLIDLIDKIINKYIQIIIHTEDKIFVSTKQNLDKTKLFLKFFLPKINSKTSEEPDLTEKQDESNNKDIQIQEEHTEKSNIILNEQNTKGDNIHASILPSIDDHGKNGLFHITFRIEGRKKSIFRYSKYVSLNRESNKLAFILYSDEKCEDYIIFKLTSELEKIIELIKSEEFVSVINDFFTTETYKDLCKYITLDIFVQMNKENILKDFISKYMYVVGMKLIENIVDKILQLIFFTFADLCFYK